MKNAGIFATRKEAAKDLGVTPPALTDWTKEPWFPTGAVEKDSRGRNRNWNVPAIRAAREAMARKGSDKSEAARQIKVDLDKEKLRRERIRADREAREENIAQGNVLPRDELTLTLRELITLTRDRMLTEPAREAAKDFPKQRRQIFATWEKTMAKILEEFSRQLEQVLLDLPTQT